MKEKNHNFPARILAFADAKIMGAMDTYSLWGDSDLYNTEQEGKRADSCFYVKEEGVKLRIKSLESEMMKVRLKLAELENRGKYDEDYILDAVAYMSKVIDLALNIQKERWTKEGDENAIRS